MKLLLTLILLLLTGQSGATPVKILIIPFENSTGDSNNDSLKTGIPEILTVCFSNYPDTVIILDRSSLDATLAEQSLSWENYVSQNNLQAIGQVMDVDYILKGSIIFNARQLQIQALLFDVSSTVLRNTASSSIDLSRLVNSLCQNIALPLVNTLNKNTTQRLPFQFEDTPEKQQLFITGLNHYYNGEFAQSFSPFLKLVKDHPNDANPHYWLAQSFYRAGLKDFATIQFQDFINRFQDDPRFVKVNNLLNTLKTSSLEKAQSNE